MPKEMRATPVVRSTVYVVPIVNPRAARSAAVAAARPYRVVALFTLTATEAAGDRQRADGRARERLLRHARGGCLRDRAVEAGQVEVPGVDGRGAEADERQRREQHTEDDGLPLVHVATAQLPVAVDLAHDAPRGTSSLGSTSTRACRTGRWCSAARTARWSPSSRYMTPRYWTTCANMSP